MIYVVSHKMYDSPKVDEVYKTIYVGDKVREDAKEKRFLVDSEGDSISEKNPYFCELTALYWIWKNDKTSEWIGLNHYRRYFVSSSSNQILTKSDIENYLLSYDVVLWKKIVLKESVEQFYYRSTGYRKDILLLKRTLKTLYPDYLETFEEILKSNSASYANMFIMKKKDFNKYCEWLFKILFELEKKIDMSGYTIQEKRVYGYLGEILLNVWVKKNKLSVAYCDVLNTEMGRMTSTDKIKVAIKKLIKTIVYFPRGIKYKRLYKR